MVKNVHRIQKVCALAVLVLGSCLATSVQAAVPSKTTVVYFGVLKAEEFELKIKPLFADNVGRCKSCEIVNYTPYNKDGSVDVEALQKKVTSLPEQVSFVYFDFNMRVNDDNKQLVSTLNDKVDSGLVVVGTAGVPQATEASGPLSRTVLGQTHGALIIGELSERDRLMPSGFYGPEMLTALRPPRGQNGQGFSPLIFAANLAENWQKRSSTEWVSHFKTKKEKSRKIWLDLNDLF